MNDAQNPNDQRPLTETSQRRAALERIQKGAKGKKCGYPKAAPRSEGLLRNPASPISVRYVVIGTIFGFCAGCLVASVLNAQGMVSVAVSLACAVIGGLVSALVPKQ